MNGLLIDLIVIAFIAIVSLVYMKKGLLRSLFSLVSFFISFVASIVLQPVINGVLIGIGIINNETDMVDLLVINIVSYVAVSVILIIILFVIGSFLDIFSKLPIVGSLNSLGGFLFGILFGAVICSFVFSIISISGTWANTGEIVVLIDNSFISKFFYENNLFLLLQ
ncbi:MAG: CvpA family protein [Clostridia bacterium]|nr:CvpA family protein [Clostridia bacterium]